MTLRVSKLLALVCPKSLTEKITDTNKHVEDDRNSLGSDESEVETIEDQPSLDMTSLQATGEYFVTSQAFPQYKQRLHQFLHPDRGKTDELAKAQDAYRDRDEDPMEMSTAFHTGPINTCAERSLDDDDDEQDGKRNQKCIVEHKTDDNPHGSRSQNAYESFPRPSQGQILRMPWETDSFATWVTKWVTDTVWPPSEGSQGMWYLCVSSSP